MCLIFLALKKHRDYKMVIAANRDEFYNRRTAAADHWPDHPDLIGGRDLEAGGTWLGMTLGGKISMITNYRDPKNINPSAPSRGQLVSDFLIEDVDAEKYIRDIQPRANVYNGFNLIVGNTEELFYLSNYGKGIQHLSAGLFGLSNHLLETPWPKIVRGKAKMEKLLSDPSPLLPARLFEVLYDDVFAEDTMLPDTGVGLERERVLSSMFIKSPGYGTRCSTVILVDHQNKVSFTERVFDLKTFEFSEKRFDFEIKKDPVKN
jgi:uncharacterized protein with NRDE domain